MDLNLILCLILALMLVIMSAWSVSVFIRLEAASKTYDSDDIFESACKITKAGVVSGKWISICVLILSLMIMILTSFRLYKNKN